MTGQPMKDATIPGCRAAPTERTQHFNWLVTRFCRPSGSRRRMRRLVTTTIGCDAARRSTVSASSAEAVMIHAVHHRSAGLRTGRRA